MAITKINFPEIAILGEEGLDYDTLDLCISNDNPYIPIACFKDGEILTVKKTGKSSFLYNMCISRSPIPDRTFAGFTASLFDGYLTNGHRLWGLQSHSNFIEAPCTYICTTGTIFTKSKRPARVSESGFVYTYKPLMCMCVKREELFKLNPDKKETFPFNPLQYCLVVDNSFLNDEWNFKLYRNIHKSYIQPMSEVIDVLHTNDIMKLCFNSPKLSLPMFRTMPELLSFTNSSANQLLSEALQVEADKITEKTAKDVEDGKGEITRAVVEQMATANREQVERQSDGVSLAQITVA